MAMPLGHLAVGTPAHALTSGGVPTSEHFAVTGALVIVTFLNDG